MKADRYGVATLEGRHRCSADRANAGREVVVGVLLQFFLSNFCTIFPQHRLLVSSGSCTV